ncbi:MAG: DUF6607 family protein [Pseudomonadota bacterium]
MNVYRALTISSLVFVLGSLTAPLQAYEPETKEAAAGEAQDVVPGRQYTFSWQFLNDDEMTPRGGTTRGTAVDLVSTPTEQWQQLQAPDLSDKERDRRAILAMAGPYRTSFDFIETVGFTEGYEPGRPYQSWGTEYIYVVADEPDFISLQHVMVMQMVLEDGSVSEPMVMKHWRQDWRYEDRDLHTFRGGDTWERNKLKRRDVKGRWTQTVYQVDDSPRYEAVGEWEHTANYSSWRSDETWRPLPRREFSVRDDYDVLVGINHHTITPTGWVHEQENLKVVLDEDGEKDSVLAREAGLARYERISGFDWQSGDEYWARTGPFWAVVRDVWNDIYEEEDSVILAEYVDSQPLYFAMFTLAEESTADAFDADGTRSAVEALLAGYLRN